MIVGSPSASVVNICIKGHLLNYKLDFGQTWQKYLYIALFDNCSNDFGQHRLKIGFQDEKFKNVLV